jgi:hypothetical protein
VIGNVAGTSTCIGGVIGYVNSVDGASATGTARIEKSGFIGTVSTTTASGYIGGFIGIVYSNAPVTITDCYARGSVNTIATTPNVGGFIGLTNYGQPATFTNCYASATISGGVAASTGAFLGVRVNAAATFSNCYYDTGVTSRLAAGGTGLAGITGISTAAMKTQSTFASWNFVSVWEMGAVSGYPIIQGHRDVDVDPIIHIYTAADLAAFRDTVNAGTYNGMLVLLENDVDLTA